jgi:formylglycine-generating enzyme required for sulfatase activity
MRWGARLLLIGGLLALLELAVWYLGPKVWTPRPDPHWVTVPAGTFKMGRMDASVQEQPEHSRAVAAFAVARYETTYADYAACVSARGCTPPDPDRLAVANLGQHPVTGVSWAQARRYCAWVGGRLPREDEWEKAATWDAEHGDKLLTMVGNTFEHGKGGTAAVGSFPEGRSPYGLDDMVGNVWEWTSSRFAPYPYLADDGREDANAAGERVVRGGSFMDVRQVTTGTNRLPVSPDERSPTVGFRCARSLGGAR